jgi:TatD DNase family protein
MIDLIDIGANLTHDSFDPDRDEIIKRADEAGVKRLIVTGTSLEASQQAIDLTELYPNRLFATAGVHPHHAASINSDTLAILRTLAKAESVVAVGECGLDFFRDYSPRDAQLAAFEEQLRIATDVKKPVFLHQREAHDAMINLLRQYLPEIVGGVAHCFTGNASELKDYLDIGLYIGITGWICDERRGNELRDAVKFLPLDRILLETDAPYLLPRDLPDKPGGRRNEPSTLPHILDRVAHYMNRPVAEVAAAATRNTEELFRL